MVDAVSQEDGKEALHRFKSGKVGKVEEVLVGPGQDLRPGAKILKFVGGCAHPTIMKVPVVLFFQCCGSGLGQICMFFCGSLSGKKPSIWKNKYKLLISHLFLVFVKESNIGSKFDITKEA